MPGDLTKYRFDGKIYNKRRLVLAVVKKYHEKHPEVSFEKLKTAFFYKNLRVVETLAEAKRRGKSRHFFGAGELVHLSCGQIAAVSNQWGGEPGAARDTYGSLDDFLELAKKMEFTIEPIPQPK